MHWKTPGGGLTNLTSAASRSPCIWDAFEALRCEIERICVDFFLDNSEARHFTRSFQHSVDTSGGFGALLSIKRPSLNRRLMRTFVAIFWNHISSIFFPLPFPLTSHSVTPSHVSCCIGYVHFNVAEDVQKHKGSIQVLEGTYLHIPAWRTAPWQVAVAFPSCIGGQGLWPGASLPTPVPSSSSRMECLWSPPTQASSYPWCAYVSCCGAFDATCHHRPCWWPTTSSRCRPPTSPCLCHTQRCNNSTKSTGVNNTGLHSLY